MSLPRDEIEVLAQYQRDALRYRFIRDALQQQIQQHPYIAGIYIRPPPKKYWFDDLKDIDKSIDHAMKEAGYA